MDSTDIIYNIILDNLEYSSILDYQVYEFFIDNKNTYVYSEIPNDIISTHVVDVINIDKEELKNKCINDGINISIQEFDLGTWYSCYRPKTLKR